MVPQGIHWGLNARVQFAACQRLGRAPDGDSAGQQQTGLPATPGSGLDKFNVAYFAASCDEPEINSKYAQALKLDYPILSDADKKIAQAYGVVHQSRQVPERWTFYVGQDGKILHIDKNVKPASHGADIAKQLKKLGV